MRTVERQDPVCVVRERREVEVAIDSGRIFAVHLLDPPEPGEGKAKDNRIPIERLAAGSGLRIRATSDVLL